MPTMTYKQDSEQLDVEYDYEYDAGVWMDADGSGYPPSEHCEIIKIIWKGVDVTDLLFEVADNFISELEEAACKNENESEYDPEDFKE
jgi:hypothetical protein